MAFSIDTTDKLVRVNPGASLLNLNYSDVASLLGNPLATAGEYKQIHVVGVLHNDELPDYSFYIENVSDRVGWNVTDCIETEEPRYAPPAAPLVPLLAEKYTLVTDVPAYQTPEEAHSQTSKVGDLSAGDYYVYADGDGVLNLSTDNHHPGLWVNEIDNVVPPPPPEPKEVVLGNWVSPRESSVTPEPETDNSVPEVLEVPPELPDITWKDSYIPYDEPRLYVCNIAYPATNIDPDGRPVSIMVYAGDDVTVYGHFFREGIKFYRLHVKSDVEYVLWVALPAVHKERAVLVKPAPSWADRIFHRYQQTMTSIFPIKVDGEDRYLDNVKLEPFKKRSNKRRLQK